MANCQQNFFQVHQRLLRGWDFRRIFYFLLEKLLEFVMTLKFNGMHKNNK